MAVFFMLIEMLRNKVRETPFLHMRSIVQLIMHERLRFNSRILAGGFMKYIKKLIPFLCFLAITMVAVNASSKVFKPKWTTNTDAYMTNLMQGFYHQENDSLDALFVGDSSAYRGISPLEFWKASNMTSYVYASPGQKTWISYYMIRHALESQKPKMIFLEANVLLSDEDPQDGYIRKVFDNMKWGSAKMDAMNDPVFKNNAADKISYVFPIFQYHNRYNELSSKDFSQAFTQLDSNEKGFAKNYHTEAYEDQRNYMENKDAEGFEIPAKTKEYTDKIVKLCAKENIQLVLLKVPAAKGWTYDHQEAIQEYANVKGIPFLDLNYNMGNKPIDWQNDTADGGVHLNILGATKATEEVSRFVEKTYPQFTYTDHKESVVKNFDESYELYMKDREVGIAKMKEKEEH